MYQSHTHIVIDLLIILDSGKYRWQSSRHLFLFSGFLTDEPAWLSRRRCRRLLPHLQMLCLLPVEILRNIETLVKMLLSRVQGTVKFIQRMMGCSTATSPNKLLFDSAPLHDEALGLDVSMKHWGTGLTKWMMFSRTIPTNLELNAVCTVVFYV